MIEKRYKNKGGDILVRFCPETQIGRCGIVEMLHLYDKNESGCVIGAWVVRDVDGQPFPEFRIIHDRLTITKYSIDILEAIKFGQKLAEVCVEIQLNEKKRIQTERS